MRLGRSKARMQPDKKAKVMTCHSAIRPTITRVARMKKHGSRTELGKNHDASSVGAIGNDAAEESQGDRWDGKGESGQSKQQRRVGELQH